MLNAILIFFAFFAGIITGMVIKVYQILKIISRENKNV